MTFSRNSCRHKTYLRKDKSKARPPTWAHCVEYEFQLRREAKKLCREQGFSIQAAPWAAYRNQEHRVKHWVTLLSIANSRCDTMSDKASREVEQLKKKQVVQLQKARSRSPGEPKGPEKVHEVNWLCKTLRHSLRTKEKEGEPKVTKVTAAKERVNIPAVFADLLNKVGLKVLHKHSKTNPGFCFPFQSGSSSKQHCRQHHNCAGCDNVGVPYKDCLCLAHL